MPVSVLEFRVINSEVQHPIHVSGTQKFSTLSRSTESENDFLCIVLQTPEMRYEQLLVKYIYVVLD